MTSKIPIRANKQIFNEFRATGERLIAKLNNLSAIVQNDMVSDQAEIEEWGRKMGEVMEETSTDLVSLADMTWNHIHGSPP